MSGRRTEARRQRTRRRVALLGVFAVLFQAILFGWHHHELPPATRGSHPIVTVSSANSPLSPASDADECDICMALHHQSASPVEFVFLPAPIAAASALHLPALFLLPRVSGRGFQARAPPRGAKRQV